MQTTLDRNLLKQEKAVKKIEKLKLELFNLKNEQVELENETVIKEFRSKKISLDEFLKIVRDNKKEEKHEKSLIEKAKLETTENNDWRNKINEKDK